MRHKIGKVTYEPRSFEPLIKLMLNIHICTEPLDIPFVMLNSQADSSCSTGFNVLVYTYTKDQNSQNVLYTYTAARRDVLGCTSPTTKRFPEAREMHLEGQGKSRGRKGCTFSHPQQERIDFNTVNLSLPTRMD